MLKILEVEGAIERAGSKWRRTSEPWNYDEERLVRVTEIRRAEQAAMETYGRTGKCLSIRAQLFHFRTHGGRKVDLMLEADDGRVVGIEVKASATVDRRDFLGLETLREAAGSRFHRGVVLYTGTEVLPFGPGMFALPVSALWDKGVGSSRER